MDNTTTEAIWVHTEYACYTLDDVTGRCGLTVDEVKDLVEFGLIDPEGHRPQEWRFSGPTIELVQRASRLKRDFGTNVEGAALALMFLERIAELETRIRELECERLR